MGKKAALHNLGCKVNAYETEEMRRLLEEAGYEIVPFEPGADVYVVNTCTVTNIADRKSRQMLHKARKMNPQAIVVAAGCYAQLAGDQNADDAAADIVLGNDHKKDLIEALAIFEKTRLADNPETEISAEADMPVMDNLQPGEHTRSFIKVQDGCNQFCSYCIIPYARGRVKSRTPEDIVMETEDMAQKGCREIVLTGIHLSSYGSDLDTSLLSLIKKVNEIQGIERIRLGSLEPGIVTEKFARELAVLPKICPHFHLSLQSGCDSVLKRMNRHYTAQEYEEKCEILRENFDRPALTTDVITGFPGETPEEFGETVEFLNKIHLYETHIFKYSKRQGTRAAAMPDQIPEAEKSRRSGILLKLGEQNRTLFEKESGNRRAEVLFEEEETIEGVRYFTGYTKEYIRAAVYADRDYRNITAAGTLGKEISPHIFLLEGTEILSD